MARRLGVGALRALARRVRRRIRRRACRFARRALLWSLAALPWWWNLAWWLGSLGLVALGGLVLLQSAM